LNPQQQSQLLPNIAVSSNFGPVGTHHSQGGDSRQSMNRFEKEMISRTLKHKKIKNIEHIESNSSSMRMDRVPLSKTGFDPNLGVVPDNEHISFRQKQKWN